MINKIINEILTEPEFVGEIKSLLKQAIIARVKELIHVPQLETVAAFTPAEEPAEAPVLAEPAIPQEESDVASQNRRENVLRIALEQLKEHRSVIEEALSSGIKIGQIAKMLAKPVFYVGSFIHAIGWEWSSTSQGYVPREVEPWQQKIFDKVFADTTDSEMQPSEPEAGPEAVEESEPVVESEESLHLEEEQEPASTSEQLVIGPEREAVLKYQSDMEYLGRQKKMIEHHVKKNCSPTKILKKLHPLEKDEYLEIYVNNEFNKHWSSAKCCWI